jgi:DNA polymerase epsilon subunit 1
MDLDDFVTCQSAFQQLKKMLMEWNSGIMDDNICSQLLFDNFFRWISSSNESKMADPFLLRLIHNLMKKSFLQLIYQFREHGCEIVHASYSKLLLHTKMKTFDEAQNYINYVIKTILEMNMFIFLKMEPSEYWRTLLYKDSFNFTGFKESIPDHPINRWNVSNHLPEAIQMDFRRIAAEYVIKVYHYN